MDVANCLPDVSFRLGFTNYTEMTTDTQFVTLAELYQFADDATKFLARATSLFLTYDASVNVVAATALYNLPAPQIFTVTAWLVYSGLPLQQLRLSTVGQLFALDANWPATSGAPKRLSLDAGGIGTGTLYPNPVANSTLAEVLEVAPGTVASGSSTLNVSPVLQDALSYWILAQARGKESDSRMDDMARHFQSRFDLYAQVAQHLFGEGQ